MSLINLNNGISAAGGAISQTAGTAALLQQKAGLEEDSARLVNQLTTAREAGLETQRESFQREMQGPDIEAKRLALVPQRLSIDAYLKATGHPGGLSEFQGSGAAPAAGATGSAPSASGGSGGDTSVAQATASPAPSYAPSGSDNTAPPAAAPRTSVTSAPAQDLFPNGAPVLTPIGDKGKILGIPLPPGWTPQMAAIAGPDALSKAWEKYSSPQTVRAGASLTYFDFNTGKMQTLVQQPNTPPGYLYDAATQSYVQIGHGLDALTASKKSESQGTAEGALPSDLTKIAKTGEQTRTTASFQKGLDVGTDLVPSYDPATQKTTMVTKADALKKARGGAGVIAPPDGTDASGAGDAGVQKDGSYRTDAGTIIPPAPKAQAGTDDYQTAPSEAQKATQSTYAETIKGWQEAVLPANQAEQRFLAQAEALKAIQSGQWASTKAAIGAHLIAAGMSSDTVKEMLNTDPAAAQVIMKNNFGAALSTLGASKLGRITQNEIFAMQKNLSNTDLQPEANLAIIAQGVGIARFQQSLANDWNTAMRMGYADPLTYQQKWMAANPLQKFVDQAQKEIGALKGMPGGPGNASPAKVYGPPPGTVVDDYKFLGGNPKDPKSWEPAAQ